MKYFCLIIIFITFTFNCMVAQTVKTDDPYQNFGLYFDYHQNYHIADFQKLPDIPNCCPNFTGGKGSGVYLGGFFEYLFIPKVSGTLRLGYSSLNGLFEATEPQYISLAGTGVEGEIEHRIDANLSIISIEPMLNYYLTDNIKISGGMNFGILINKKFSQFEEIIKPQGQVSFLDSTGKPSGEYIRNRYSGDIPKASGLIVSAIVGLGYELPMNKEKSFLLIPEISFCYGISPFVNGLKWTANSFNIGLSIAYSTAKYKMESPKIEEKVIKGTKLLLAENEIEVLGNPDNLIYASFDIKANETADKILKSEIFADIKAVGISDGAEYPQAVIHVEEFLSLNMRPLLNYVFFENGSTIIPDRYLKLNPEDKGKFEINNLANESTLSTYYQILNIIGKRMQQFPSAILTLVGCNSDNENEKGNKQLSKDRVEAVANYFYKIWGIAQKRIIVKSRNLPESPSNVSVQDGIEENRRVEILSDTYQILDPVITNDTVVKVSPTVIRFKNFVKTTNGVAEWKLQLYEKNKIIKVFSGIDSVPSQQDWFLDKEKKIIPTKTDSISFALEVKDKAGDVQVTKTDFLSIDQQTLKKKQENKAGDKRIDHYCLILFKYNSSELSPANVIITEYIKSNLKNNSKILISGYTDRMGDPNYNIDLSESRAKAISKIINSKNTFIRAVGSNDLLYNNDLPEGRFYSRTVEVEVETPIKW